MVAGCSIAGNPPAEKGQVAKVELNVAAAASLTDAMKEVVALYQTKHPEITLVCNYGASGTLQKQIEAGAPCDLFISAGQKQMDALQKGTLIVDTSRKNLLGNTLVLVAPENSSLQGFDQLTGPDIKSISVGEPETVPAGQYAKESLQSLKIWDQVQAKLILAKDVKQVLTYVVGGDVDAGLVYQSDLYNVNKVKKVAVAPDDSHKPIVYPLALIRAGKHQNETQAFADFLFSPEASQIFAKYGFKPLQ